MHASEKKNRKDRSGRGARRYKERGTHAYSMGVSSATLSSYPHRSDTDSPVSLVARPSSTARFSHRAVSRAEGFRAFSLRVSSPFRRSRRSRASRPDHQFFASAVEFSPRDSPLYIGATRTDDSARARRGAIFLAGPTSGPHSTRSHVYVVWWQSVGTAAVP